MQEILEGENFRASIESENFVNKTFAECIINLSHVGEWGMLNFMEKTFTSAFEAA